MHKQYILIIVMVPVLFTSCSQPQGWGMPAMVTLFALMLIMFGAMFYLIFRKKRQADRSLTKFTNDLNVSLQKFDEPQQKAKLLENLIERIGNDDKYKKDEDWRNKVLVCALQPLASAYYKMGDEARALGVCSRIIDLNDEHIMSHYNRGSIYSDMGLYDKALKDFDRAIELMPSYASTFNNRGLVYEKMQQYEKAIEDYTTTLGLEESAIAYFNRANSYLLLKKYDDALHDYQNYLDLDKDNVIGLRDEVKNAMTEIGSKLGL